MDVAQVTALTIGVACRVQSLQHSILYNDVHQSRGAAQCPSHTQSTTSTWPGVTEIMGKDDRIRELMGKDDRIRGLMGKDDRIRELMGKNDRIRRG